MHPVIGEEIARKILRRLKFDNQTIKQVTTLVRWHDRRFASFEEVNKKTIRRWVSKLTPELFARLMVVQRADINAQSDYHKEQKEQVLNETKRLFEEIIEEKNCLSIKDQWKRLDGYGSSTGKRNRRNFVMAARSGIRTACIK